MINLCLVVIATQFSETKKRETERMMQERKRFQSSSTLASNSEPGGCYSEILKYLAHLWRRAKRKIIKVYYNARGKTHLHHKIKPEFSLRSRKRKGTTHTSSSSSHYSIRNRTACPSCRFNYYYQLLSTNENYATHINNHVSRRNSSPLAPRASPEISDIEPVSSPRHPNFLTVPSANSLHPSSVDSIHSLAVSTTEALTPSLLKPCVPSPNHLTPQHASISRASSLTSGGSRQPLPVLPEALATHNASRQSQASQHSSFKNSTNVLHTPDCHGNQVRMCRIGSIGKPLT